MANLWVRKPLSQLMAQASDSDKGLKRTLGSWNLILLGIGAIIGAGLFVRTAAAAGGHAGAAVTISFIIAAVGCAFAGLCYAEFASMIPIAGSAYTYAYATMGELIAWIIGWALVLEYALGAATVAIAWSEYLNLLLGGVVPYEWCHSPMESILVDGVRHAGIMNAPALIILLLLTMLLIRGTSQSAFVNGIIVVIKVSIVLLVIALGWQYINPINHTPFLIPADAPAVTLPDGSLYSYTNFFRHGWGGVLTGAGVVFFAFIGFDAVSTAAQEAKNPSRDMPIGILGSLAVCTILYILFSHVLTGLAPYTEFMQAGKEASVAYAITHHMPAEYAWLATSVTVAILAGFSSVILVMLMGQSRVFYSMSNDGLLPKVFSEVHPTYRTPYKSNMILFLFVGGFAAFIPGSVAGDLTSIGTLFAFVLVCAGVWIMRRNNPDTARPFRTPLVPLVPILGMLICTAMIVGLPGPTLLSALGWMILGLLVYFGYSQKHSKLQK
jgi:APA family basic amino acid/polyamine antiporter